MGSHVVDVGGELHKTRLLADGTVSDAPVSGGRPEEQRGEGCRVNGHMIVKRVPGNFHISCHSHADLLHVFFGSERMNVSHEIHHLSFGDEVIVDAARASNPLNGVAKSGGDPEKDPHPLSYEYYIKVVPTSFVDLSGVERKSYQFVANSNSVAGHYRLPAAFFRYDLSPITMVFRETKTPTMHFLVQVCAIVGGVFTVLGLVNSVLSSTVQRLMKKAEMGKLG